MQQPRTRRTVPSALALAFLTALGVIAGVVWERNHQPWRVDGDAITLRGAQVLRLSSGERSLLLDGRESGVVEVMGPGESTRISSTGGASRIDLGGPQGEVSLVSDASGVRASGATRFERVELIVPATTEAPTVVWTDRAGTRTTCTLAPGGAGCVSP